MPDLLPRPIRHDHGAFLEEAGRKPGFDAEYSALGPEYEVARELLAARRAAGLTQEDVASFMGTSKSAISRLEAGSRHSPTLATLRRYAEAVGCRLEIRLISEAVAPNT